MLLVLVDSNQGGRMSSSKNGVLKKVSADQFVPILRWFIVGIALALLAMSLIIALMEMR